MDGPVAAERALRQGAVVRWSRLFADLESRLQADRDAEFAVEVAERTRIEIGKVSLADRLRAAAGRRIVVATVAGRPYRARLDAVGVDWLVVIDDRQTERLVALLMVEAFGQLPADVAPPYDGAGTQIAWRLDLRHALRGISRDRSHVRVVLTSGLVVIGTIDRVGADFIDVAEHEPGEPRRAGNVGAVQTLPLRAVVEVIRADR